MDNKIYGHLECQCLEYLDRIEETDYRNSELDHLITIGFLFDVLLSNSIVLSKIEDNDIKVYMIHTEALKDKIFSIYIYDDSNTIELNYRGTVIEPYGYSNSDCVALRAKLEVMSGISLT